MVESYTVVFVDFLMEYLCEAKENENCWEGMFMFLILTLHV